MKKNKEVEKILSRFSGKRKYLHYWLAGFVDGEGSFSVAIIKTKYHRFGFAINPVFQVYQHKKDRAILEVYQHVLKTGKIYRKSGIHPVLNFSIDSQRNLLEKVIPFFDKYPLITKHDSYQKFRYIVKSISENKHATPEGFKELVNIAYSMNQKGKGRRRTKVEIFKQIDKAES